MAQATLQTDQSFDQKPLTWQLVLAPTLAVAGVAIGRIGITETPSWSAVAAISLAIAGLVLVGMMIAQRPRNLLVLALGAATAVLARYSAHPSWESVHLLFIVMASVAGVAIVVLLLPRQLRMAVISFAAVFHFLGVLSAITSPPPQSWLSNWSWVTLFRHHLVFCYTNNAYQFYSPEPGPATLLWFCVDMKNGEKVWYKVPRKPETHLDPMSVEFFRRLSMTEAINQNASLQSVPADVMQDRLQMVRLYPILADVPAIAQYRPPMQHVRRILASYVRHVLAMPEFKDQATNVRVYRVQHRMLSAQEFADGRNPFGESTYLPYYFGNFDATGTQLEPDDPMLYWLLPIIRKAVTVTPMTRPGVEAVENHLKVHAGSDPFEERYGANP